MAEKPSLTILCPVFQEEQVIGKFASRLLAVLDGLKERYLSDVLFVVDQSPDRTLEVLKQLAAGDSRLRILSLSSRFGHQMSLLAGIDHCRSDVLVMMDSDLQHPPELIPQLLDQYEAGHDIVSTIRQSSEDVGPLRKAGSWLFYKALNWLSDVPIEPNAADFRLLSRKVVRVFQESIREQNQFLRGLFGWVGFKKTSLSFQAGNRAGGKSKYSFARLLRFAFNGVLSFSKTPLKAAIVVGLLFATVGLVLVIVTTIQFFVYTQLPSGWTTIVTLISGFAGIQLIFMGVVGLYVGAIFDEVKARPHYIIDESVNVLESAAASRTRVG
jgi:dolichol-phosphate mannosyltransferase